MVVRCQQHRIAEARTLVLQRLPGSTVVESHLNQVKLHVPPGGRDDAKLSLVTIFRTMDEARHGGSVIDYSVSQTTLEDVSTGLPVCLARTCREAAPDLWGQQRGRGLSPNSYSLAEIFYNKVSIVSIALQVFMRFAQMQKMEENSPSSSGGCLDWLVKCVNPLRTKEVKPSSSMKIE